MAWRPYAGAIDLTLFVYCFINDVSFCIPIVHDISTFCEYWLLNFVMHDLYYFKTILHMLNISLVWGHIIDVINIKTTSDGHRIDAHDVNMMSFWPWNDSQNGKFRLMAHISLLDILLHITQYTCIIVFYVRDTLFVFIYIYVYVNIWPVFS